MAMVDFMRPSRSAAFVVIAAFAGCLLRPAVAGTETAIHFTLDRKIDGPAAPFFVAVEKGYFQAEGLNVTIDAATGSPESLNRLTTGAYQMGVADLNSLIELRVTKEDVGKVIGKEGRTAQSMRTILTAVSTKLGRRAHLDIVD